MDDGVKIQQRPSARRLPPTVSAPPVDPQIAAIVAARHGDPFAFLGMHETGDGLMVRAMLPGAETVDVIDATAGALASAAERVHPDGVFVARLPGRKERFPYRLRARWGEHVHEFDDAYCFPPVLGDLDLH